MKKESTCFLCKLFVWAFIFTTGFISGAVATLLL